MRILQRHCNLIGAGERAEAVLKAAAKERGRRVEVRQVVRRARQLRPAEVDRVVGLYGELGSIAGTARELGVHEQTVRRHLLARGVELKVPRAMDASQRADAVRLYESGLSLRAIVGRMGFDKGVVSRVLREEGVVVRANTARSPERQGSSG